MRFCVNISFILVSYVYTCGPECLRVNYVCRGTHGVQTSVSDLLEQMLQEVVGFLM